MSQDFAEEGILKEVEEEVSKSSKQLMADLIREANRPPATGGEEDRIKHLLKRIGVHQILLDEQAQNANEQAQRLNVTLSRLTWIAVLFTFLSLVGTWVGSIYAVRAYYQQIAPGVIQKQ